MKPCRRCGGEKEPGPRRHYCDACQPVVTAERARRYAVKPCRRCDGPKEPGHPGWYCAACRPVVAEERRQRRLREQNERRERRRVSTEPFRKALRELGWSRSHLARLLGWIRPNGRPDEPRVRHTLQRPTVNRATALRLAEVLGLWPVDLGV